VLSLPTEINRFYLGYFEKSERIFAVNLPLFTYGVLMFPEVLAALTAESFSIEPGKVYGWSRARVCHPNWDNSPILIESTGVWLEGAVISGLSEKSLLILDAFEGVPSGDFKRGVIKVECGALRNTKALVYFPGEALLALQAGPWDLEYFKNDLLPAYVESVVRPFLNQL